MTTTTQTDNGRQDKRPVTKEREKPPAENPHRQKEPGRNEIAHYQSMIETVKAVKRPVLATAAIGVVLQTCVLIAGFALNAPDGAREFEPVDICHHGMRAIFEKSDHGILLDGSVIRDIKKYQFNFERIVSIKIVDSMNCIVTARFADGDRRYKVKLEKSPRFRHGYRILDARGIR